MNPIFPKVRAADPHLMAANRFYYIYSTEAGKTEPGFTVWRSPDLISWEDRGMALRLADIPWAPKVEDWAPACIERNGLFYLYFCAQSRTGVAVAKSPEGPFRDVHGAPLIAFRSDLSAIDPMAFIDDDGQAYLHFGAVPGYWSQDKGSEANTILQLTPIALRSASPPPTPPAPSGHRSPPWHPRHPHSQSRLESHP